MCRSLSGCVFGEGSGLLLKEWSSGHRSLRRVGVWIMCMKRRIMAGTPKQSHMRAKELLNGIVGTHFSGSTFCLI
jgi:ribosomal protein L39E